MKEDERDIIVREGEAGSVDELPNRAVGDWTDLLEKARIGREDTVRDQIVNARIRENLAEHYMKYNK